MKNFTINCKINASFYELSIAQKKSAVACYDIYMYGHWIAIIGKKDNMAAYQILSYKIKLSNNEVLAIGKQIDAHLNSYNVAYQTVPYYNMLQQAS